MNKKIGLLLLGLVFPTIFYAQIITGLATKWSDEFTEWTIFTDDEELEGELVMRWQLQGDFSEWDYRIGDEAGSIKLKWKDNPSEWEIRGYDDIVTARMIWSNDFREWRISNNTINLRLKSKYGNTFDEWSIREDDYGDFVIYTSWQGDPREWEIIDELDEDISLEMKMALIFISTFHSFPKN